MTTARRVTPTRGKPTTPDHARRELLPLAVVLAELGDEHGPLARSTFDDWRAKGRAPRVIKLPNGQLRVARSDLNTWLDNQVENTAAA